MSFALKFEETSTLLKIDLTQNFMSKCQRSVKNSPKEAKIRVFPQNFFYFFKNVLLYEKNILCVHKTSPVNHAYNLYNKHLYKI